MNIDIEKLRKDLIDYYGTAMQINPIAIIELSKVETSTEEQLINIAIKNNFDLTNYLVEENTLKL